jgi:hypothetical protein
MSKKRKLESLQQLGILKASDVKQVQAKLNPAYRVEASAITRHNVRWTSLVVVLALGWGGVAAALGVAWRLSH